MRAKIAAVVDEHRIAVNAGEAAGVQQGDTVILFRVVNVTDPDSGESLGSVSVPKLNLAVESVQERFCVAVVTDTYVTGQQGEGLAAILRPRYRKQVSERSVTDRHTVRIKIGEEAVISLSENTDATESADEAPEG